MDKEGSMTILYYYDVSESYKYFVEEVEEEAAEDLGTRQFESAKRASIFLYDIK